MSREVLGSDGERVRATVRVRGRPPGRAERSAWVLVFVALVLDLGLTSYGLDHGFSELNPLANAVLGGFGTGGLVLVKLSVVSVAVLGRRTLASHERWVVPLALAVPWVLAVVLNSCLLVLG